MAAKTIDLGFPIVHYNAHSNIPMDEFREAWDSNINWAIDAAYDPDMQEEGSNYFFSIINVFASKVMIISLALLTLLVTAVSNNSGTTTIFTYLGVPFIILALLVAVFSMVAMQKSDRRAQSLKNGADFVVLESARLWLKARYGFLPENWEENFISLLVEEPHKEDRFTETYQLTTRTINGEELLIVRNINGEAPVEA